jgi:hypothetical protein
MKLSISEILKKAAQFKKENDTIEYLRANNSVLMETILRGAYDKTIVWALPPGPASYKPNDIVDQQHRLYAECRRMYLFIEGGNPNLPALRIEALFIELLESIDPADAELINTIKDKKLPYSNLTKELILKAFPGIYAA